MRAPSDRGATAVEFGLLLAALAIGIVSAASVAGGALREIFTSAVSAIVG